METDTFTQADRKELIKQGILLEQLDKSFLALLKVVEDLEKVKADKSELNKENLTGLEFRVRSLEDSRLTLATQIKSTLWWVGFVSASIGVLGHFLIDKFVKVG